MAKGQSASRRLSRVEVLGKEVSEFLGPREWGGVLSYREFYGLEKKGR